MPKAQNLQHDGNRVIIHFDYDCFYASVVENENPALKSLPLAIQQKQIIVTCNYEARRRGLHKLQLVTEAKKTCPDVVIVLGEDISRFRDVSKELFNFLRARIWSGRAERLGFDEVWLDCTDMIDYNRDLLNHNDLSHSFFCLDREDPTTGFDFDASRVSGPTFPKGQLDDSRLDLDEREIQTRLVLGSHLARHLRHELESQRGYTSTAGIATNKVLSKLVGNVNKPRNQTTILPLSEDKLTAGTVNQFMDEHELSKVPGLGFKLTQKIRAHVLGREPAFAAGLMYGGTKENVTVRDVRLHPGMSSELLEEILNGPGSPKGIGGKIWALLHGIDESEVGKAKNVPSQISQEDSYMKYLHTFEQVRQQLLLLSDRLVRRMRIDLTEDNDFEEEGDARRWLAHPRTLRLSTRPRPPVNADGTRSRTFSRISHSAPMPNFVFNFSETSLALAEKLVDKTLVTMFRRLHPKRNGWNLSLINIAATNMADAAADTRESQGRDIGRMFRRQDDVLKDFRIRDQDSETTSADDTVLLLSSSEDHNSNFVRAGQCEDGICAKPSQHSMYMSANETPSADRAIKNNQGDEYAPEYEETEGEAEGEAERDQGRACLSLQCQVCGMQIPAFATDAHQRFHLMAD